MKKMKFITGWMILALLTSLVCSIPVYSAAITDKSIGGIIDVLGGTDPPTTTGENITAIPAGNVDITDSGSIITATEVEAALQENRTAIDLNTTKALNDLTDVDTSASQTDYVLKSSNGNYIFAPSPSFSGSVGTTFYMDDAAVTATGADNDISVKSLLKHPSGSAEHVHTISAANNTVIDVAFLYDAAMGGLTIDAGEWLFTTYASVDSVLGGRISSITRNIYHVVVDGSTVTTTGTGTSRTATSAAGTPFASGDADAAIIDSGYLQTPQGLYQITGYTSTTVVTIETPTTYTNEVGAAFNTWKKKFGVNTGTITALNTSYESHRVRIVEPEISIAATDKLAEIVFGISNNTTDIYMAHNGEEHYSHFRSPIVTRHNTLPGLNEGDYTHLSAAQKVIATQEADTDNSGYLLTADWDTFNNKQAVPVVYAKTTSATLTATEVSGLNTLHNDGAGAEVILTWLALVTGQEAMFYVNDVQYLQIKAPAATTIRIGAVTTAANGYIRSNTVGNWVRVKAMPDGLAVMGVGGTWTYDE